MAIRHELNYVLVQYMSHRNEVFKLPADLWTHQTLTAIHLNKMSLTRAILFCAILTVVFGDEGCPCMSEDKTVNEIEEFRKFLLNLPEKVEFEEQYPIVPGELSPLVRCECASKERKKREFIHVPKFPEGKQHNRWGTLRRHLEFKKPVSFSNRKANCPPGFRWVAIVNICANAKKF